MRRTLNEVSEQGLLKKTVEMVNFLMTSELANTATITLVYDAKFKKFVTEDGNPGMWITTQIEVGGTPLWNFDYDMDGLATDIVIKSLASVRAAITDERYYITFEDGPSWIVVEPHGNDSVNIVDCVQKDYIRNPDDRLDIESQIPVTKRAWAEAVFDMAYDFQKTVIDLNPELRDSSSLRSIDKNITEITEFAAANCDEIQL